MTTTMNNVQLVQLIQEAIELYDVMKHLGETNAREWEDRKQMPWTQKQMIEHAMWMCVQVLRLVENQQYNKAIHYIGFARGIAWSQRFIILKPEE